MINILSAAYLLLNVACVSGKGDMQFADFALRMLQGRQKTNAVSSGERMLPPKPPTPPTPHTHHSHGTGGSGTGDSEWEPSPMPSGMPTTQPTPQATVNIFNKLSYEAKTIYYAKVLDVNSTITVYEDDVFEMDFYCDRPAAHEGIVDLSITNNNDYAIQCVVDSNLHTYYVYYLTPGQTVTIDFFNYVTKSNQPRQHEGFDSAVFCSDGNFLASYGDTSVFFEDHYTLKSRISNNDCGVAGFIRIGDPNERFTNQGSSNNAWFGYTDDNVNFFNAKPDVKSQSGKHTITSSSAPSESASQHYAGVLYTAVLGSSIGFLTSIVAIFLSLKYMTRQSTTLVDATEMDETVKPEVVASWGKRSKHIPEIEF